MKKEESFWEDFVGLFVVHDDIVGWALAIISIPLFLAKWGWKLAKRIFA